MAASRLRLWLIALILLFACPQLRAAEDTKASGSLTAVDQAVRISMPAVGSLAFQITGTFSATITFEASVNGADFVAVPATNLNSGAKATTATATGIYIVHAPGARYIRARCSTFVSGPVVVFGNASLAPLSTAALGTSAAGVVDTELPAATTFDVNNGNAIVAAPQVGALLHLFDPIDNVVKLVRPARSITDDSPGGANAAAALMLWDGTDFDRGRAETTPYPTGTQRVVAGGYTKIVSATLTRPANTTAYASGDEVTDTGGAIRTFTSAARATGLSGVITGASVSFSSNWATKPSLELWIFDTTSTPIVDNSAFAPTDGVNDTLLGIIPLATTYQGDATGSTGNFAMDSGSVNIPYVTVGSANLFGRLVIRNAGQAGANSDTLVIRLRVLQD